MRFNSLLLFVPLVFTGTFRPITFSKTSSPEAPAVQTLDISVKVLGNRALTTYTMTLFNGSNKDLEKTLSISLPEGAQVTRYALDVDGKMREGVPVEKVTSTQVFEQVEKRRIDPGLLEKTEGNTFRTRVYPVPAGGERKVIIAFEQELKVNKQEEVYHLPLPFADTLSRFSLHIQVQSTSIPLIKSSPLKNLIFSNDNSTYTCFDSANNVVLSEPLTIALPLAKESHDNFLQWKNRNGYFYISSFLRGSQKEKALPRKIAVIWDVSLSSLYRNTTKELAVLESYLKKCKNAIISLYTLNHQFNSLGNYSMNKDQGAALFGKVRQLVYDGGTDLSKIPALDEDEVLLFNDGNSSLSDISQLHTNGILYTLSSSTKTNNDALKSLSQSNGGLFLNLAVLSTEQAIDQLTHQPLLFLGLKESGLLTEHYPSQPVPVADGFSMSGKFKSTPAALTLRFGYGKTVSFEKKLQAAYQNLDSSIWNLEKLFVQQKIAELDAAYDSHKDEILSLGRQYSIVTRNTSLLVLENVRDYVQYKIEPPAELREEYKRLLKEEQDQRKENQKDCLENAVEYTSILTKWWNTDFPVKEKTKRLHVSPALRADSISTSVTQRSYAPVFPPPPPRSPQAEGEQMYVQSDLISKQEFLPGKVAGLQIQEVVVTGYSSKLRGISAVAMNSDKLIVVDGKPSATLPPKETIEKVEEMSQSAAVGIYGSKALNGVLLVTTKNKKEEPEIEIVEKDSREPYMEILQKAPEHGQYAVYLQLREKELFNPVFYYDMARHFGKTNKTLGLQILTNLAELDFQNHELYKLLGFTLKEWGIKDLQPFIFKKVLQWRPQEPQSYRDYALALEENGMHQQALDTLYLALAKEYDSDVMKDYEGIEETIVTEINHLISRYGKRLRTTRIPKALIHPLPVDIRVVLNWNMKDTDIDLWVTDPKGEKCFYNHTETRIGGRISDDFTEGYGPEQFLLKKAIKGKYTIQVHYYGDNSAKLAGKTTLMVEIYTNYGKPNEQRKVITLQLEEKEQEGIYVGSFDF